MQTTILGGKYGIGRRDRGLLRGTRLIRWVVTSCLVFCFLATTACCQSTTAVSDSSISSVQEYSGLFGDRYPLEILPQMELLSAVFGQTSWRDKFGPRGGRGNSYYQAMGLLMKPLKDHEAVALADELIQRQFMYGAPAMFACHLGPLPELELKYEYSSDLVGWARGRQYLEDLRIELKSLAVEAKFMEFLEEWRPYLEDCVRKQSARFHCDRVFDWVRDFYGPGIDELHIVLAPAMLSGGGFGVTVSGAGRSIAYGVALELGYSETDLEFPSGRWMESLALHELGHSYANEAVETALKSLERDFVKRDALQRLFTPVYVQMGSMGYGTLEGFLNEQFLRAATCLGERDLYGFMAYLSTVSTEQRQGFYLTEFMAKQMAYYTHHREQYPTFKSFASFLMDKIATSGLTPGWYVDPEMRFWVGGPLLVVAVAFLARLVLSRYRRCRIPRT